MRKEPEVLSAVQREQLNRRHEYLSEFERVRYYTLSPEEIQLIQKRRGDANQLGFAIQLCYLRYPGRALQPQEAVPDALLSYVARQLDLDMRAFEQYAQRDTTRREHLCKIQETYGYKTFSQTHYNNLRDWLCPIALGTDKATALVSEVLNELQRRKVLVPALSTVERLVWEVQRQSQQQVFECLTQSLDASQKQKLDELILTEDGQPSQLTWLKQVSLRPSPKSFKGLVERIQFIRQLGLAQEIGQNIPQSRLLQLAREGSRYTSQKFRKFDQTRRYAVLVAFLVYQLQELIDRTLAMHDRLMTTVFNQAKRKHQAEFQANGKAINEKVKLYATIGKALITAREKEQDWLSAIESVLPWEQFVETVLEAEKLAYPYAFDYLDRLDDHYSYLRQYTPLLLDCFEFEATKPYNSMTEAINVLRQLNETRQRSVHPFTY